MNTTIAALFCTLLISGVAHAQDDGDEGMRIDFESSDSNNDGYITRDELPADHPLLIRFETMDSNGDERLSPDELEDVS